MTELTERQKQIMELVAKGLTNRQVAAALEIAPQTVKNTLSEIFERLEATNRVSATLKFLGVQ
jgi:DNA-binding NarL/FixJ family response regulator